MICSVAQNVVEQTYTGLCLAAIGLKIVHLSFLYLTFAPTA